MKVAIHFGFDEGGALRLLNWLAREDARILRARPELPLLYDAGIVYCRERGEVWSDVTNLLVEGHEDCDALAAYRAGELLARGGAALLPGDAGYRPYLALRRKGHRFDSIRAEVMLTTRTRPGNPGLYHCIVRYRLGNRWYLDDPSARLGMRGGRIDPVVRARWARRGVEPKITSCPLAS